MQYGYFNDDSREYVITTPKTPVKWINYVGTLGFGGFVDSTGGGLLCKNDPSVNRIIKYIGQMPASDFKGQTLFARFRKPGQSAAQATTFSPFFVPSLCPWQKWECRIGLGYTRFLTRFFDLEFDIKIFVPDGQAREIRDIRVTNRSTEPLQLELIPVVEYTHFDALKQLTNADWVPQTMQSDAIKESTGHLVLTQAAFMMKNTSVNWFTSNQPVSSFTSDRKRFLGDNEYGTWAHPVSLQAEELDNYEARRGDNIAALLHRMGTLQPGQEVRLITQLGQEPDVKAALPEIQAWRSASKVDAAFDALAVFWKDWLAACQIDSPDSAFNSMVNIHNPRQCYMTKNWSRYLSMYQLGFGSDRGIGFRDSSQDVMGVMSHMPEEARELMEKLLSVQKQNGSAMHQFNPVSMVATVGDSHEYPDRPHYYSDDHLWIVLATANYLRETGKLDFLKKEIAFYEKDANGQPKEKGTVLEHLKRAIAYTHGDLGQHGLPLLGFADWNDTVNLPTGAESLFTANLFGRALLEMIDLMTVLGDSATAKQYQAWHAEMAKSVNDKAWDGAWYYQYFDHTGKPIGSKSDEYGKVWLNAQTWAVYSGFATADKAKSAMDSAHKHLNTSNGLKLSWPGYNGYDRNKGGVSTYPPGAKENGGIFLHTNPWAMIASCMMGDGERAWQYYQQINPATRNDTLDLFEVEPYVYPQNILGDEHPQFGLGRNSWLSGTASWAYQAATQYIVGVRAEHQGLRIDPCIPAALKKFSVTRRYRGAVYQINIENPNGLNNGVQSIVVDGKKIEGNVAPVFNDNRTHIVSLVLGK